MLKSVCYKEVTMSWLWCILSWIFPVFRCFRPRVTPFGW